MNDLVKFGGGSLPTNAADLANGLQHVSAGLTGRSGGMPILRLLRHGVFAYGQEDIEPQEGSEWAINPHSIMHGFACWGSKETKTEGELLGEAMVPLNQPPPNVNELQDHGEPWKQQISFQLQCLNGEDTGVTVIYKSTSIGYLNMAKAIIDQVVLQLQHDPSTYVPVVELEVGHYHHKKHGKTFFPVLDVLRWVSIDGDPGEMSEGEKAGHEGDDEAPDEKPAEEKPAAKRRGRAKAKPDEADESTAEPDAGKAGEDEAEPQPTRSRRRRRAS